MDYMEMGVVGRVKNDTHAPLGWRCSETEMGRVEKEQNLGAGGGGWKNIQ